MPAFLAFLLGGFINIAGTLAGRVLIGLGISVITYSGLTTTFDWLTTQALASFAGLPATVIGLLAVLKVGSCISMVASAIAVRLTIEGVTGGALKKWVHT